MNRVNQILQHEKYDQHIQRIEDLERTRIYCKHGLDHFINVARIAYILNLEEEAEIDKEIIYAAGLLHDVGRWVEYELGIDHALASKELAKEILDDCGYNREEREWIEDAIAHHSIKENHNSALSQYLYRADKLSRFCISCESIGTCKKFSNGERPVFQY